MSLFKEQFCWSHQIGAATVYKGQIDRLGFKAHSYLRNSLRKTQ